ncbi:MAG TPA: D-alanine--D-alanine ligase, partial [Candidatus Paceibacterota bacterium]|nr:D-alanine--D-alanine ligase [Candidatus Paceibacterota bacterium]
MATTAKPVLVLFGGVSAEHEISIITGLQVLEHIDTKAYAPHAVYVTKTGETRYLPGLASRKGFLTAAQKQVSFGKDKDGGYLEVEGAFGKRIYPYAAYFAFHGGTGEGGAYAGLMEACGIPFTAAGQEGSAIAMNKWLTKEVLESESVRVVPGVRFFGSDMRDTAATRAEIAIASLGLPAIVKPAHLGSSIGIAVARTQVELEKALLAASFVDSEIVVEKYLEGFVEYNCSVRLANGAIETSPIERPIAADEILSFADKYERGAKKS